MKKLHFLLCLVMVLTVSALWGQEKIPLVQGGDSHLIQLPFVLKSYQILPSDTKVFRVEEMESHLRVIPGIIGEASLIVNGITGDQRTYSIVVTSNLAKTVGKIRTDLDELTELEISLDDDRILIVGTVTSPEHWAHLQRVLAMYKDKPIVNFASFAPSSDALLDLKKRLEDAGFSFAESRETQKSGELLLTSNKDTIFLSGELFNQKAIEDVNRVIDTAPIMVGDLVKKVVNLTVSEKILDVSVAFVSLSDSDNFTRTGNLNPIGNFDLSILRRFLDGDSTVKTIGLGSSMGGTLSFLQSNLVSKVMEQGSVSFPNGGKASNTYGGTVKVPVSGIDSGDLKDVNFGYDVTISGELTSDNTVKLDMDLSQEEVVTDEKGNYVQKKTKVQLTLPLELNMTHIVSHHKKLTEMNSEVGFPILRKIPIIKLFFSDEGERKEVVNVLVLVSASVRTKTTGVKIELDPTEPLDRVEKDTHELLDESTSVGDDLEKIFH